MSDYRSIAERLLHSRYAIALTGAGISVESGIPDFRSKDGLWSKFDPEEYGFIGSFRSNPKKVWKMLFEMDRLLSRAQPNAAHRALADLEKMGILKAVITQNVDSLHQLAGSTNVIEFHGHGRSLRCDSCSREYPREEVSLEILPPTCSCGAPLRPDFVFFGEEIPSEAYERAMIATEKCDFIMVVGTSATVAPASMLPRTAKNGGAFFLEVNPSRTGLTEIYSDVYLPEPAGKALPAVVAALNSQKK